MNGILNILKPPGMTSHDVVSYVRRNSGQKKVGHTGTLDPGAAGVLTVCLGRATRIIEYLPSNKNYRAELTFGITTTTQDAFGEIIKFPGADGLTFEDVEEKLRCFKGKIKQVPPMTSAIKFRGKKLYELARAGIEVERKSRVVHIYNIDMADFYYIDGIPRAIVDISCSAGTYVRTICHDLGEKIGCGAYMSFLLRTKAGSFSLDDAITLEYLTKAIKDGNLQSVLVPMKDSLDQLARVCLRGNLVNAICCGNRIKLPTAEVGLNLSAEQIVRLESSDRLLALATAKHDPKTPDHYLFQPVKVFV